MRTSVTAPAISIVVPTHNRAALIRRAIESVLAQDVVDFELIVVDDGSTDDTSTVVASVGDDRVRYLHQANAGAAAARNRGADHARAALLTFLDSDDEALPGWLHAMTAAFTNGADIVSCGFVAVDADPPHAVRKTSMPRSMGPAFADLSAMFTHGGTFALRTEIFRRVGGYAPGLPAAQHTELAYRILPLAIEMGLSVQSIMLPLIRYYVGSEGSIRKSNVAVYEAARYIITTHGDRLRLDARRLANSHAVAGSQAARLGLNRESLRHNLRALRLQPRSGRAWARVGAALCPPLQRRLRAPLPGDVDA